MIVYDYKKCKCGACFIYFEKEYKQIGGNFDKIVLADQDEIEKNCYYQRTKRKKDFYFNKELGICN